MSPAFIERVLGIDQTEQSMARAELRTCVQESKEWLESRYRRASDAGYSRDDVEGQILNAFWQWFSERYGRRPTPQERRQLGLV